MLLSVLLVSSWIDTDTPPSALTTTSGRDGAELSLVFSDEFEVAQRSFYDGHDSRWTAIQLAPNTNEQVNFYNASLGSTRDGKLVLQTIYQPVELPWGETRYIQSPMLQSWNKFCFSGGLAEVRARMPGRYNQPGIWPAFWLMGNLGRATFAHSTDGLWPYSFDECVEESDPDCEANQCRSQLITACNETPGFGLNPRQGRGSPEIDIIETQPGPASLSYGVGDRFQGLGCSTPDANTTSALHLQQPFVSTSLQMAPGMPESARERPKQGCSPRDDQWYPELSIFQRGSAASPYNTTTNYEFWGDDFAAYHHGAGLVTDAYSVKCGSRPSPSPSSSPSTSPSPSP